MNLQFANDLLDWHWKHGVQRIDKYILSPSGWVRTLYDSRDDLAAAAVAAQEVQPAFGVWGPSQTGKSMLVSGYFDKYALASRVKGEDGKNSALHWPGGEPCYFF